MSTLNLMNTNLAAQIHSHYNANNPLFAKDAYKTQHLFQYPKGTEVIYSNLTARGANHFTWEGFDGKVVVAGLQGFVAEMLHDYWNDEFFAKPADDVIGQYQAMADSALGKGVLPVQHLYDLHALGYLPVRVKALPEGSRVDLRIPLLTITNTDTRFAWLPNFLETVLSNYTWKPITVATIAYQYRVLLNHFAWATGADSEFVKFQGHDFSARGMAGNVDSRTAGLGHLFSFVGSDTLEAGQFACEYYDADWTKELVLCAPPATEHAVMCANYAIHGERETFRRLIQDVYPTGMVAIVSDTIDFWNVLTNVLPSLKDEIENRSDGPTGPGKVVVRPDSGSPIKIITGDNEWPVFRDHERPDLDAPEADRIEGLRYFTYLHYFGASHQLFQVEQTRRCISVNSYTGEATYYTVTFPVGEYGIGASTDAAALIQSATVTEFEPTPEQMGALQVLWKHFGGSTNNQGFRHLNPSVGLVYGDSITLEICERILTRMMELGFASTNVVFGIGSFTYQYLTRDTFGLAIKATWAQINGEGYDLQKKPATDDSKVKHSAKGRLRVERDKEDLHYVLLEEQDVEGEAGGELRVIFEDGALHHQDSLATIRERLWPTKVDPAIAERFNQALQQLV